MNHHQIPLQQSDHQPAAVPLADGAEFDVVVVGARVAGAATAMLAARAGLSVLLLEQGRVGTDALSTHALLRGGVMQLHRWGLLGEVVAAGTPAVRRTTIRHNDEEIVISMKSSHGVDALYAPRRTLLDPMLVRAAIDAGVILQEETAVRALRYEGGRVAGVVAVNRGRRVTVRARVVVGADGTRSTVARLAGAATTRSGTASTAVTYGYWSDFDADGYEWNFEPDGCSGIIPTNDGKVCVFAGAGGTRIGRGGVGVIRDVVAIGSADAAERLRAATPPAGTRTWCGRPGYLRQAFGPGWALVGDAGSFKDPISAHGLTDAMRDAELLARAIVAGLGDDEHRLTTELAAFEELRDRLSIPVLDVADEIAGNRWSRQSIGDLLLQMNSAIAVEVDVLAALDRDVVP